MRPDTPVPIVEPVDALRLAGTYDEDTDTPQLIETHISFVFLTDTHVYKLKKPVDLGFLDYSTPTKRRQACEAEVELNRRLAPDVYLGALPVGRDDRGRWKVGGDAMPEDWVVKMRRLPEDRCLKQMIRGWADEDHDVQRIVAMLSKFYRGLPAVNLPDYAERYRQHVVENGNELLDPRHDLPSRLVKRAQAAQLQFLFLHGQVLRERVANGHVVEGHGDLRAEHIYLTDPPVAIDGIEFSRELRLVDTADELCFLAMTCEDLDASELGQSVLDRVCEQLDDQPNPTLLNFYRTYRACVRAKVAALRSDQASGNAESGSHGRAVQLLKLADQYASGLDNPLAIIVRGLSGTGKTTLAKAVADRIGAEHLATDAIRKTTEANHEASGDEVSYDRESRQRVYAAMFAQAEQNLHDRVPIVVDGTFLQPDQVRQANERFKDAGGNVTVVTCVCPREDAINRIRARQQQKNSLSDADEAVYEQQQREATSFPADLIGLEIDTTKDVEQVIETLQSHCQECSTNIP